ncbi:MAG: AbrB/MazE/SpoVT family DNA-binding domain-containing protein [Halobacteriota archaeon]|uniref:AbrB/MazE/SpoVT family DNA-binding domain-containing protein n=1 Tax=Natronomonas sp. TaxID=2184060 RepID=UPI003976DECC
MADKDDTDGTMWPPNLLRAMQETSEQATRQQQEALRNLFMGGKSAGTPDLGDISEQLGTMTQMATFKTRIQSGGRISIPDAEREALDIGEGDIVQTVIVPVKRNRDDE